MNLTPKPRAIEQLPSSADALAGRTSPSQPGEGILQMCGQFHEKYEIVEPGGCWVWMGATDRDGYGRLQTGSRASGNRLVLRAHRVSYEIAFGSIPNGLCVLHRCDNPPCVNPEHLFLGTNADNSADMVRKGRASKLRGENHHSTKITDLQVAEIRSLNETLTHREIATRFGISRGHVTNLTSEKYRPPFVTRHAERSAPPALAFGPLPAGMTPAPSH